MKTTGREIINELISRLWQQYSERVVYAQKYAAMVTGKGGKIVTDHVAFRTLNAHTGEQPEGIRAIKHILGFFDYKVAMKYSFSKKNLNGVHFEHEDASLPKIFVSQLEVEKLPVWAQEMIHETVKDTRYLLSDKSIEILNLLKEKGNVPDEAAGFLIDDLIQYFRRPWNIPHKTDILKLNDVSQYGAWVLLYGNSVNHFSILTNLQNIKEWPDLETTNKALLESGIPMKDTIEGSRESILRQTATKAIKEELRVKGESGFEKITWPYAYLEFTQRGYLEEEGEQKMFNGFLPSQLEHLFEMTLTRDN